jgi:transcriptional regulator with XRE-family HTH domain
LEGPKLRGLRRERLRAGLTQEELARLAGTTQHTISEAEGGKRAPRTSTLYKLSDALGVPTASLFTPEPTRSHLDILSEAVAEMEELVTVAERFEDPLEGMQAATQNSRAVIYAAFQIMRAISTERVRADRLDDAHDLIEQFLGLGVRNAAQARKALRGQRSAPGEAGRPAPELAGRVEELLDEAELVYAGAA